MNVDPENRNKKVTVDDSILHHGVKLDEIKFECVSVANIQHTSE